MNLLHTHPTFLYPNEIKQICTPLLSLGITYFSHIMIDEHGKLTGIGSGPEFAEFWLKKKYYNFDIHQAPLPKGQSYTIWDHTPRDPGLDEMYEAFKLFSLGHSLTISFEDINHCKHFYNFAAQLGNESINNKYNHILDILKMFILYFNEKVNRSRELKKAYDIQIGPTYLNNTLIQNEHCDKLFLPVNRIYFSPGIYLTPREFQCLQWLSQGKTIEEIAIILSTSVRTMKAHISNIKVKLGCKNLFQLGLAYRAFMEINAKNPALYNLRNNADK